MNFFKTSFIIGVSQVLVVIILIIRTKIIATMLGTEGIGLIGNTMTFVDFSVNILSFGLQLSILRYVSENLAKNNFNNITQIFSTSLIFHIVLCIIGSIIFFYNIRYFSLAIYNRNNFEFLLLIVALSIPFTLLQYDFISLFNAFTMIKVLAYINILNSIIGLFALIGLIKLFHIDGVFYSFFANALIMMIITLIFYLVHINKKHKIIKISFSPQIFVRCFKYGFFSQLAVVFNSTTAYLLRVIITQMLFISGVGLFNAAISLGASFLITQNVIGTYSYPKISSLVDNKLKIIVEVNFIFRYVLLFLFPLMAIFILFSDFFIKLLLSKDFIILVSILGWVIVARFFEIAQSIIALPIFILERYKFYLSVQFLFNVLLIGSTYFLTKYFSITGAILSQGIIYFILFIMYFIIANRIYSFKLKRENLILLISGIIILLLSIYLCTFAWYFRAFFLVISLSILLSNIKAKEKSDIKLLIKTYITTSKLFKS